jgi:hypothetical protein
MSPALKVGLWIGGVIVAALAIIIIAGLLIGNTVADDVQQGAAFAKTASHDQCIDEIARRVSLCDGLKCTMGLSAFGGTCLTQATGDREKFCESVPLPSNEAGVAPWRSAFCTARRFDERVCNVTAGLVTVSCENYKARPR